MYAQILLPSLAPSRGTSRFVGTPARGRHEGGIETAALLQLIGLVFID